MFASLLSEFISSHEQDTFRVAVNLRIQSEYRKIRTRNKTPYLGTFHAVFLMTVFFREFFSNKKQNKEEDLLQNLKNFNSLNAKVAII